MLEKITELANKDKNISDFHLRGGSDIAYRILGDINIEPNSKIEEKDIEISFNTSNFLITKLVISVSYFRIPIV